MGVSDKRSVVQSRVFLIFMFLSSWPPFLPAALPRMAGPYKVFIFASYRNPRQMDHLAGISIRCSLVTFILLDVSSGFAVDRLNHGIDVAEAVSIGLIVALWVVVAAGNVVRINAVAVAHVFEGL